MRHIIVAAGVVALAGCGQGGAGENGQAGADRNATTAAGSSGKWDAENACTLLDKATVGSALGTEVVKTEAGPATRRTDQLAGFSTCFYTLADGQQLAFMARQSPGPDNTPEAIKRARDETVASIGPVEDVSGVGRSAFWTPTLRQLVVFMDDDRYFNLTLPANPDGKDPKTLALGLATRIK